MAQSRAQSQDHSTTIFEVLSFVIMFLTKVMVYPVLLFFSTFNDIHKHSCCTCGLYTTTKCSNQKFWFCIHNNSLAKSITYREYLYSKYLEKEKSNSSEIFSRVTISVPPNSWHWMHEPSAVLPLRCSYQS